MQKKPLEWSVRASTELIRIIEFYSLEASAIVAEEAYVAIEKAVQLIQSNPLQYREGKRKGTREYIVRRFPHIVVYRVRTSKIQIVRVLHQALRYFN
jgi:toxin ParE1/3/4